MRLQPEQENSYMLVADDSQTLENRKSLICVIAQLFRFCLEAVMTRFSALVDCVPPSTLCIRKRYQRRSFYTVLENFKGVV